VKYLSVCSGVEAASVAWQPLGWGPVAFSEIEPFPAAVLAHHYTNVPNWGDMTAHKEWPDAKVDVLVGGTPCQSFSVAGLRQGMADPRGNLALCFLGVVERYCPEWVVWENVPGVLSSGQGRDFGSFVGALAKLGYGFAYRVLDAQYWGVAQRRRRVFVVANHRDWRRAAAVLFDEACLRGDSAPRREAGQEVAGTIGRGVRNSTELDNNGAYIIDPLVRRLTPRECERLQGLPDDYTLVPYRGKPAKDTPRYRAIGNSFAVPVVRWIGERIELVEEAINGNAN